MLVRCYRDCPTDVFLTVRLRLWVWGEDPRDEVPSWSLPDRGQVTSVQHHRDVDLVKVPAGFLRGKVVSSFPHLAGSPWLRPATPQWGSWPPWADMSAQLLWDSGKGSSLYLPTREASSYFGCSAFRGSWAWWDTL